MDNKNETNPNPIESTEEQENQFNQIASILQLLNGQSPSTINSNSISNSNQTETIQQESSKHQEFTNFVNDIISTPQDSEDKPQEIKQITNSNIYLDILSGKISIIDSWILKHSDTSIDNVRSLTTLTMKISKDFGMLYDIGLHLPLLQEFNLSNSHINSIEDFGVSFNKLKILNVSHCHLKDLTGLVCFENWEEFDVSYNDIDDLFELEMCSSIKVIRLNDNKIEKEENFTFIAALENLKKCYVKNNPFVKYWNNWKISSICLD